VQAEFPKAAFGQVVSTIIAINQFTYSFGPGLLGWLRDGFGTFFGEWPSSPGIR
jgi:hypothetical protein